MDLLRPETIEAALEGIQVAICAAGPFQAMPVTLAQLCIQRGIHYIDFADDREFVRHVRALPQSSAAVCSGWSAVPALSAVLTRIAVEGIETVESIFIQIAPGNRSPRGHGTVTSLLSSVGKPFMVWRDRHWEPATGWSAPREFRFPAPVGLRVGYLVDVADHEIFPDLFGADRVEFRVGAEVSVLNHAVSLLAGFSRRGIVRDWTRWAPVLRMGMAAFSFAGSDCGAVGVEVTGGGLQRRACVVAEKTGQRIPVMPAAVMVGMLLSHPASFCGHVPLDGWIRRDQLEAECRRRGFRLVVEEETL